MGHMDLPGGENRIDFMSRLRMGGDRNRRIRLGGRGKIGFMWAMWEKTVEEHLRDGMEP